MYGVQLIYLAYIQFVVFVEHGIQFSVISIVKLFVLMKSASLIKFD